jgi:hypothetical protein
VVFEGNVNSRNVLGLFGINLPKIIGNNPWIKEEITFIKKYRITIPKASHNGQKSTKIAVGVGWSWSS